MRSWLSAWSFSATRSTASPRCNALTGTPTRVLDHVAIYPASHYVASKEKWRRRLKSIKGEMEERVAEYCKNHDKLSWRPSACHAHYI